MPLSRILRVALAEDYAPIRTILRQKLMTDPHIEVVGEANSPADLLTLCKNEKPAVLFLDLFMPGPSAPITITQLLADTPSLKILIISEEEDDVFIRVTTQMPIFGYLLKGDVPDYLFEAMFAVFGGNRWYSPSLRSKLEE